MIFCKRIYTSYLLLTFTALIVFGTGHVSATPSKRWLHTYGNETYNSLSAAESAMRNNLSNNSNPDIAAIAPYIELHEVRSGSNGKSQRIYRPTVLPVNIGQSHFYSALWFSSLEEATNYPGRNKCKYEIVNVSEPEVSGPPPGGLTGSPRPPGDADGYYWYKYTFQHRYWSYDSENGGCRSEPTGISESSIWEAKPGNCEPGYRPGKMFDSTQVCKPKVNTSPSIYSTQIQYCSVTEGNPCSPITGNKTESETDYEGFGLKFERSYNSANQTPMLVGEYGRAGPVMGIGWRHHYSANTNIMPGGNQVPLINKGDHFIGGIDSFYRVDRDPDNSNGRLIRRGDGTVYKIDWNYYQLPLAEITDPSGNTTVLDKSESGLLEAVTGPFGHRLTFEYDDFSRLTTLTDPAGGTIRYEYDEAKPGFPATSRLIKVTYQDNTTREYLYEDTSLPYHLTGIVRNGIRYSTYGYDSRGRAVSSEHSGGADRILIDYSDNGTSQVTYADNTQKIYYTNESNTNTIDRPVRVDVNGEPGEVYEYEPTGRQRITYKKDKNGNVTEYEYDDYHRTLVREYYGDFPGDTSQERVTSYRYLSDHHDLVTEIRSPGVSGQDQVVSIAYDPVALKASEVTVSGFTPDGSAVSRTTRYKYNSYGQMTEEDGPRTDVSDITVYNYYECATGNECGRLRTVSNSLGHTLTYHEYDAHGRVRRMTDINGTETRYTYHVRHGKPATVTQDGVTTHYGYNDEGLLTSMTNAQNEKVRYDYDPSDRLIKISDAAGNYVTFNYDLRGNINETSLFDPSGGLRKTSLQGFNHLRQLESVTNARSETEHYTYDPNGNLKTIRDRDQNMSERFYDALDRLKEVKDQEEAVTKYGYDINDRLISVTDARSLTTHYEYDDLGNLRKQISPDTGITTFGYDEAGNLTEKRDARGTLVHYQYDALNRLTSIHYPDSPSENVSYAYDNITDGNYGTGQLTSVTDQTGSVSYRYDRRGNLVSEHRNIESQAYITRYRYNELNRLTGMTYPSGKTVHYEYDLNGRIEQIITQETESSPSEIIVSDVSYLPFGPMDSITFGNGMVRSLGYNQDYQLTDISSSVIQYSYDYDPPGNIASITDALTPPDSQTFDYDRVSRLKMASRPSGTVNYEYDDVGNRTLRTLTGSTNRSETYAYAGDSNRLTQINTDENGAMHQRQLGYTATGNLKTDVSSERSLSLEYNAGIRLEAVSENGSDLAAYVYNANGQRTIKVASVPAANVHFHYDQSGQLIAETSPSGELIRETVYLNSVPVAVTVNDAGINRPPEVNITSPQTGSRFGTTETIQFVASANDAEDGNISHRITWVSDQDGTLGTGDSLSVTLSEGTHTITASVSDSGLLSHNASIVVQVSVNQAGHLDLNAYTVESFGGSQDTSGTVSVSPSGNEITLQGNLWKSIALSYNITGNTVLEFEFRSSSTGELHGIGFDTDSAISPDSTFQLYGTQNWGIRDFKNYPGDNQFKSYQINVGQYFTGQMNRLVFVMDHDVANPAGESVFRNIRIYENTGSNSQPVVEITHPADGFEMIQGTPLSLEATATDHEDGDLSSQINWTSDLDGVMGTGASLSIELSVGQHVLTAEVTDSSQVSADVSVSVVVTESTTPEFIDLREFTIDSYGGTQDVTGTSTVSNDGSAVTFTGNLWKSIALNYNITPDTVLEFEFSSALQGEVHGIGLDEDGDINKEYTFELYGSQNWGERAFENYHGDGSFQLFSIPVGQFYTGAKNRLFFVMDNDTGNPVSESVFKNIRLYETNP